MDEKIQNIIHLIEQSELDQTIKDILIRDLQAEGLTDFLKEQIKAYCLAGIKLYDERIAAAKQELEHQEEANPTV
jgi:pimeloyl-CoA synthetase